SSEGARCEGCNVSLLIPCLGSTIQQGPPSTDRQAGTSSAKRPEGLNSNIANCFLLGGAPAGQRPVAPQPDQHRASTARPLTFAYSHATPCPAGRARSEHRPAPAGVGATCRPNVVAAAADRRPYGLAQCGDPFGPSSLLWCQSSSWRSRRPGQSG